MRTHRLVIENKISTEALEKLKQQWAASIQSVNNSWKTPILVEDKKELELLIWPDELLKLRSEPVTGSFEYLKELVEDMFVLMYKHKGVGLSAIQVGYQTRLFIMDCSNQPSNLQQNIEPKPLVLINPEITEFIGTPSMIKEGCLSFPGVTEDAMRYPEIIIKAQNLDEEFVTYQMAGLEGQCAQHEIDHLNGKTFDRGWGKMKRDIVKRKIFKARHL